MSITAKGQELAKEVLERAERDRVRFVNLQFVDIVGMVKNVSIPIHQFPDTIEHGKWFDGSSIEGFARIAESDMFLQPDLSTFNLIPWEQGDGMRSARVICWVRTPNGDPFPGDPRYVLAKVLNEASDMGFKFNTGPELEFFIFRTDQSGIAALPHDRAGYFDLSTDLAYEVRKEMVNDLEAMGIVVETAHHEVAIGQHEIDFEYADALKTADNAVTFKYTLKAVANRHGLHVTFMPKPVFGVNGSGMHVHQSLCDLGTGKNIFFSSEDEYGMSDMAKHFIAGQLHHAPGMCAILAPLVNSYKRLVPGYEAPVYISWARVNRSALIRIPRISPGKPQSARIELRCPDPSCNPYLAFAVMLKAGLDGVKRRLPLHPPVEENLYEFDNSKLAKHNVHMLPGSLAKAMEELERDEVVQEALGEHVLERFLEAKRIESDSYRMYVSQWELDRYLEVF